jgi:radical SAM superfamily enzyme YgiQ (UPF0313 family)
MNTYRVLLFYPEFSIPSERPLVVPSSNLAIAAAIRATGREVFHVDGRISDPHPSQLEWKPDLIGISAKTAQLKQAIEFAKMARRHVPDAPIVWGSWHATIWPEQILCSGLGDFTVKGEGEETIIELLDSLESGSTVNHIRGLGWIGNGDVYVNLDREARGLYPDQLMPLDLLDRDYYEISDGTLSIFTSMGCPYSCGFCSVRRVYRRRWIAQPAEKIVERVEKLYYEEGIKFFSISDANFFVDVTRVRSFIDLILDKGLVINWSAQGHLSCINKLDREAWHRAKKSGYVLGGVGLGSGSPRMRKYLGKPAPSADIVPLVQTLEDEGIKLKHYFIVGIPGETRADLKQTVKLILEILKRAPRTRICLSLYTPVPGTRMAEEELSRGRSLRYPNTLESWAELNLNVSSPWDPASDMMIGYRRRTIFRIVSFYLWKAYIDKEWIDRASGPWIRLRKILHRFMSWRVEHWVFLLPFEWYLYRLRSFYYTRRRDSTA